MHTDYDRIRTAIEFISDHASDQPSLDVVATHVGLSPAYFQRMFQRWAGVSPKRFLQFLTASEARRMLRESRPVLDAAFAVGLSGPGRLHDLIVAMDAMTPGECARLGAGLSIRYGVHGSPFGLCLIATTDRGVCAVRFVDESNEQDTIDELGGEWPGATLVRDESETSVIAKSIFDATRSSGETPLSVLLKGTNFQLKVWEALLRIPAGSLVSYGDLAGRIGQPTATRAVASAVAANPVGYLIPCHRVIRSTGALGGYRWGVDRKALIIGREFA